MTALTIQVVRMTVSTIRRLKYEIGVLEKRAGVFRDLMSGKEVQLDPATLKSLADKNLKTGQSGGAWIAGTTRRDGGLQSELADLMQQVRTGKTLPPESAPLDEAKKNALWDRIGPVNQQIMRYNLEIEHFDTRVRERKEALAVAVREFSEQALAAAEKVDHDTAAAEKAAAGAGR